MRSSSIQILITLLAFPLCATAGDSLCNSLPEVQQHAENECECGAGLSRLPIKAPKGMSLIASCGYKKVEFVGTVGEFYFKSKGTIINGVVRRVNSPIFGDSIWFDAKIAGKPGEFAGALQTLKFGNNPEGIQKFNTPLLSEESPCWAADAAIKVSLLYVHAGYESNEDGSYPKEFEVIKVGQYKPCQVEAEDEDA